MTLEEVMQVEGDLKTFEYNGYQCEIKRHETLKHLCGYVYLPADHPLFEKEYDGIDVEVHGGLTFSGMTETGEWQIGFDCAHLGDMVPATLGYKWADIGSDVYRTMNYCEQELKALVDQLNKKD